VLEVVCPCLFDGVEDLGIDVINKFRSAVPSSSRASIAMSNSKPRKAEAGMKITLCQDNKIK